MAGKAKLLWAGEGEVPNNVRRAAGDDWQLDKLDSTRPLEMQLGSAALVAASANGKDQNLRRLINLLQSLERTSAVGVFLLGGKSHAARQVLSRRGGKYLWVNQNASPQELSAKFAAAGQLRGAITKLQERLTVSEGGNGDDLNEQVRLAGRLQRDFLPRTPPVVGSVRFSVLYRPASWVSGDIYDITRLDETHLGFYVADVVGHGMPAALLTMFIKKALQTKRITGHSYSIVPPHEALGELNADICRQQLSGCQFCTAVYCVVDVAELTLTYARAGHPEPVLVRSQRRSRTLAAPGTLLGVFEQEQFRSKQIKLKPGDRLVVYTDGAEDVIKDLHDGEAPADVQNVLTELGALSRDELLSRISAAIEARYGRTGPSDDITVMITDVEK